MKALPSKFVTATALHLKGILAETFQEQARFDNSLQRVFEQVCVHWSTTCLSSIKHLSVFSELRDDLFTGYNVVFGVGHTLFQFSILSVLVDDLVQIRELMSCRS